MKNEFNNDESSQVWKFTIDSNESDILMPYGAEILKVWTQENDVCIWAKVDTSAKKESRKFFVFGTGHDIPSNLNLKFIGTVFIDDGYLVFHVFEEIK